MFTLNGIAAYTEANSTIESFVDTPVAVRYARAAGLVSWFVRGAKSSNDTTASTAGTVGGDLVYRRQGPYASNLQPYIDKTGLTLVFERALSDAEIAALSANPWQLFRPQSRSVYFLPADGGGGATAYSLTADAGSYALSGQPATLSPLFKYTLAASAGAYSYSGLDAVLAYMPGSGSYTLTADAGTYTATGQPAGGASGRRVDGAAGAFTATGNPVALLVARRLPASGGTYAITGQDATLTFIGVAAYALTAEAGAYALAGQSATLRGPADSGVFRGAYAPEMPRRKRDKVDRIIDDVLAVLEAEKAPERVVRRAKNVVHRVVRSQQVETFAELDTKVDLAQVEAAVTRVLHKAIKQAKATRRRKQDEELLLVL